MQINQLEFPFTNTHTSSVLKLVVYDDTDDPSVHIMPHDDFSFYTIRRITEAAKTNGIDFKLYLNENILLNYTDGLTDWHLLYYK